MKKLLALMVGLSSLTAAAQSEVEMADVMRSDGKIYVVVGIILIILVGLFFYLFRLDRKIARLESQISSNKS